MKICILLCLVGITTLMTAQVDLDNEHFRFEEPQDARVILNNGTETDLQLNYNLITEEMVIDLGHSKVPYNNTADISKLVIADVTYLPIEKVFYEVIINGKVNLLLRRKRKLLLPGEETGYGKTSATAVSSTQNPVYNPDYVYLEKLPSSYNIEVEDAYFWFFENELIPLKSPKKAIKKIPDMSDDLKDFMKSNNIRGYSESELISLTEFCNEQLNQ